MDWYEENVPDELKVLNNWVGVLNEHKVPINTADGTFASSTRPITWNRYKQAHSVYSEGYLDYLGFVFNDDGYVGIDIDDGFDQDGNYSDLAIDIISACGSYTEVSRSGRGFHIILKGDLPFKGKNNLTGVEIYKSSRYFIMTGNVLDDSPIIENQDAIDYVVNKYFSAIRSSTSNTYGNRLYSPNWKGCLGESSIRIKPNYPPIPDGARNISLTSLGGSMWNQNCTLEYIRHELLRCNDIACKPPLDVSEVESIVASIGRYRR